MAHVIINAHLLGQHDGARSAGIHGYLYHTLAHLAEALPDGWRATALVGRGTPTAFPGLTVQPSRMSTARPLARIVWEQALQPWALRGADVYHAGAFVAPLTPLPPTVVTVYDLSFIHHPGRLPAARRAYLRALTSHTVRRAHQVIAISQATADDLAATLGVPPGRITVAAPGHDPAVFRPLPPDDVAAFRAAQGHPDGYWLVVGTIEPRKNLPTLLHAYAQLPAAARPPLVLAGAPGWDGGATRALVGRLGLAADVRFAGYVPPHDLPLWYNGALALLMPSLYEGFGLPVLEAMACGVPVIAADASSLPEVLAGSANLCVPPHDAQAWAAALVRARDDSAWRADAAATGRMAAARYTWAQTAHGWRQAYVKAFDADGYG